MNKISLLWFILTYHIFINNYFKSCSVDLYLQDILHFDMLKNTTNSPDFLFFIFLMSISYACHLGCVWIDACLGEAKFQPWAVDEPIVWIKSIIWIPLASMPTS
jgi:hypothetical protein